MAAILAPHNSENIEGHIADRYGNDPFVWVSPFLWSHCHARSRPQDFGRGNHGPTVNGRDAVFFVSHDRSSDEVVCDCVFVVAESVPIAAAEARFPAGHPARHYHFDHQRSKYHINSTTTRIADRNLSFIPHPPMPLGTWIESHVEQRSMSVLDYMRLKMRRNVRVVRYDAQGIYDRLRAWVKLPNHTALESLPLHTLKGVKLVYPANEPVRWAP